ncbi:MAG: hypothetical protein HOM96_01715 [Rickettsiales bacterium]|jgi:uncharacterized membrane-anchored protein|nr:hypothetical protein [Rickettsiales bacterium]
MVNLVALILFISVGLVYIFRVFPEDQFLMIIELSEYQLEIKSTLVFSGLILLITLIVFIVYFIINFFTAYRNNNYRSIIKGHQNSQVVLSDFMKNLYLRDTVKAQKNIKQLKRYLDNKSYLYRFLNLQHLMVQGDDKKIKSELLSMNCDYPNDIFILNSLGLECHKNNDYESSINYLERSVNIDCKSHNTVDVLITNYQICDEYNKLDDLIKRAIRKRLIKKNEYSKEISLNYLAMARNYYQKNDLKNYYKYSDLSFKQLEHHQYVFNNYIKSLLLRHKETKAINLIVNHWDKLAHPKLREYLITLLKNRSDKYKLKITRDLIERNCYDVESFVIFGYINKDNTDLHDEAIKYLDRAINIAKIREITELLIEIKSKYYPDTDSEIINLKKSKDNITSEYIYVCAECEEVQEHWQLICNRCNSVDQINIRLDNKNKLSLLDYS